jgi:hypothetical protein
LPGLKKHFSTSQKFSGADRAVARLLAWFRHLAPLFIHLFLLLARLTGFLIRLLLLLLARLLPAALLTTLAALLLFLLILIGHQVTPWFDLRNNAALSRNVPAPT